MIKKSLLVLVVLAVAGCAPGTPQQGVGFGTSIGGGAAALPAAMTPEAQSFAATPNLGAAPRAGLPYHTGQSRSFRRKNNPSDVRSAALSATSVGGGFLTGPERTTYTSGNTKIGLRQVRYDTHDFVIATFQGQVEFKSIWAGSFANWSPEARKVAQTHAPCSIKNAFYKSGGNTEHAIIYVLSC